MFPFAAVEQSYRVCGIENVITYLGEERCKSDVLPNALSGWRVCEGGGGAQGGRGGGDDALGVTDRDRDRDLRIIIHSIFSSITSTFYDTSKKKTWFSTRLYFFLDVWYAITPSITSFSFIINLQKKEEFFKSINFDVCHTIDCLYELNLVVLFLFSRS